MTIARKNTHLTQSNFVPFETKKPKLKLPKKYQIQSAIEHPKITLDTQLPLRIRHCEKSDTKEESSNLFEFIPSLSAIETPILSANDWKRFEEKMIALMNTDGNKEKSVNTTQQKENNLPLKSPILPFLFRFFKNNGNYVETPNVTDEERIPYDMKALYDHYLSQQGHCTP